VQVHVKKHNIFQREGNDLYCEVPIDFATATLGGSIEVPTLSSKRKQASYSDYVVKALSDFETVVQATFCAK